LKDDLHSFIVRIWKIEEDGEDKVQAWRGSIDHVGTEKRLYFYNLNGIIRFIQDQIGIDSVQPLSRWPRLSRWAINLQTFLKTHRKIQKVNNRDEYKH
jgi:hypothetical protein